MKKFFANYLHSLVLVTAWGSLLTMFGVWLFRRFSVVPTFPYYYILLLNIKDAAYALWGYFDGVHYLRIISAGYQDIGSQAFFPLYPLSVRWISHILSVPPYISGITLSLISLTGSITIIKYLFPAKKYYYILSLLLFPTSFFLIGLYTESLFLFLSLAFFLSLKHDHFFLAAILAGLASATRLVGVFLTLSLLTEILRSKSPRSYTISDWLYTIFRILISLSGFIAYAYFLWSKFGDPLMFLHVQSMFGASRSSGELIMLPQVLYRYLKMILTVDPTSFMYQRIWFELTTFILASLAWVHNLKHIPRSTSVYVLLSLILPTLTGTLSSFPRYVLVLIPFLLPATMSKSHYYLLKFTFLILLIYFFKMYCYGTFIS